MSDWPEAEGEWREAHEGVFSGAPGTSELVFVLSCFGHRGRDKMESISKVNREGEEGSGRKIVWRKKGAKDGTSLALGCKRLTRHKNKLGLDQSRPTKLM